MTKTFTCIVNSVGPSDEVPGIFQAGGVTVPVIVLELSDIGQTFTKATFYAAEDAKKEMLAVALAAISTQSQVKAILDVAARGVRPGTVRTPLRCHGLFVVAS